MQLTIKKWGNSVGVRIPHTILNELNLNIEHQVDMRIENGKIVIEPIHNEYPLEQLLAGVTPDNLHQEVEVGEPIGKEW